MSGKLLKGEKMVQINKKLLKEIQIAMLNGQSQFIDESGKIVSLEVKDSTVNDWNEPEPLN